MDTVKLTIADEAFERHFNDNNELKDIKDKVRRVRSGKIKLTDIQKDDGRLKRRIAKENTSLEQALERINGVANFQDIRIIQKIMENTKAVCRVVTANYLGNTGYGTGFLIAPNLIITNHHVIADEEIAKYSKVQFDYELDSDGHPKPTQTFKLNPNQFFMTSAHKKQEGDPYSGLDFTIVAVEEFSLDGYSIKNYKPARLIGQTGKIIDGENCVVVQHPKGDYKKIVLEDIRMLMVEGDFLIYESDTEPGSSGSMVLGMGTGEVVALHNSAVPRKNEHGQWLRKDGAVWHPGDADDAIDWVGNQGIRVSSLVRMIEQIPVANHMQTLKQSILLKSSHPIESQNTNQIPSSEDTREGTTYQFEVILSEVEQLQEDWLINAKRLVPGLVYYEALYPLSTNKQLRKYYYISVQTSKNPWTLATELEGLPQIEQCSPDLPIPTDLSKLGQQKYIDQKESFGKGAQVDWRQSDKNFKSKWRFAKWTQEAIAQEEAERYRAWNRAAVGIDRINFNNATLKKNLSQLKLVQLDTGYLKHAKVFSSYNLMEDEDFIDYGDNDAKDEVRFGRLQHFGHGMRTASIVIGRKFEQINNESPQGNHGILFHQDFKNVLLIPYRVSESVLLINRVRNVFNAMQNAIYANADIVFMCMGWLPSNMLYSMAKRAYDHGIIWVCAAGNAVQVVVAPAIYPGTIAVGAINPNDDYWTGSSKGPDIDVAAPGQDVYVPGFDQKGREVMSFGSGTSYATPHVAAAAMLWKAKYLDFLKKVKPWQRVELFRAAVSDPNNLRPFKPRFSNAYLYGPGILDIPKLLKANPKKYMDHIQYAYRHKFDAPSWDIGVREAVQEMWQKELGDHTASTESFVDLSALSKRARISVAAMTGKSITDVKESYAQITKNEQEQMVEMYVNSFSNKSTQEHE